MLSLRELTQALHAYWSSQAVSGVPTLFPGTTLDTQSLADWLEFWIDAADELPTRSAAPERIALFLTVHCFSQNTLDTLRGHSLADAVVNALAGRNIPVLSPLNQQPMAWIRTREARIRSLTRSNETSRDPALQHFVVTLTATASACPEFNA